MAFQKAKAKQIIVDPQQIENIVVDTFSAMAKIVGVTLGPAGRPVLIERDGLSHLITKDGVTVAKSLGMDNAEKNIIIDAAKEICLSTARQAGDGTTTAIVLGDAIVQHGMKFLKDNPKYNPQRFIRDLQYVYSKIIIPYIKEQSVKIQDEDELFNVAKISCNGDEEIARVVVEAIMSAGDDGTVLLEEGHDINTKVEKIEGFVITTGLKDLGSISMAFVNDTANQQCRMDNGLVFIYDGTLSDLNALSMMQDAIEANNLVGKPILIVAHDYSDLVLGRCATTMKNGTIVIPIKTPRSGLSNSRTILMQDISAYTSATIFNPATINDIKAADFGTFTSAKTNMFETFIVGSPDVTRIENRVLELKSILDVAKSDFDRMFLKAHIAKLIGGISTIWVGGTSDLEIREKKDRVEDAVEAVKAAIAEGILLGGCNTHLNIIDLLKTHSEFKSVWQVLIDALQKPFQLLIANCGEDYIEISTKLEEMRKYSKNIVFNAETHEFGDAKEFGIIEPTKVTRISLGNALSVASLLISLGGIVVAPRDLKFENQLELSNNAFKSVMSAAEGIE